MKSKNISLSPTDTIKIITEDGEVTLTIHEVEVGARRSMDIREYLKGLMVCPICGSKDCNVNVLDHGNKVAIKCPECDLEFSASVDKHPQ